MEKKRKKKHSKFWDTMVDSKTQKGAQKTARRIGRTLNIHRLRGFIRTECGD